MSDAINIQNKTFRDAAQRVIDAKMGCLMDATDDFINELRVHLYGWIDELDAETHKRIRQANKQGE